MGKPDAPQTPDYAALAKQQSDSNKINQTTPWGTSTWTPMTNPDGSTSWAQSVGLSQPQQQQFDANNKLNMGLLDTAQQGLSQVQKTMGQPLDTSGLPARVSSISGGSDATRQSVVNALMSRIRPDMQAAHDTLDAKLANQGVTMGSDAYDRMQTLQNRSDVDAQMQAQLAGGQAMAQQQQLDVNAGNFQNNSRTAGLTEAMTLQQQPLNQLNALRSGTQVSAPTFTGTQGQGVQALDAGMAQGNANNAQYQTQMQGYNGLMNGLASAGGAMIMASDPRLKDNIVRTGNHPHLPIGIYEWDWKDGSGHARGVLSTEVREVMPQAVTVGEDGFDRVNYTILGGAF